METTKIVRAEAQIAKQEPAIKSLFNREDVKAKFQEMLGKRAMQFMTSVLQIVSSNRDLSDADPNSIYGAAATAAVLDLPLNNNLGFAHLVPYNNKQPDGSYKKMCQLQIGWRGFVQLGLRTGQFKTIDVKVIYEGQLIQNNSFAGYSFDWSKKKSETIIGYAAYFSLINGFEKTFFMNVEEVNKHGKKYSKTFNNKFSVWSQDFDAMAMKTVLKQLLSKFAPLSIEMQKATVVDQAIIHDAEANDVTYADRPGEDVEIDKELERVRIFLEKCETLEDVDLLESSNPEVDSKIFEAKKEEIKAKAKK